MESGDPQTFVLNRMWGASSGRRVTNDLFKSTINAPYSLGKCKSLFSCWAFISSRGSGSNTRYNNLLDGTQDTVHSIGQSPSVLCPLHRTRSSVRSKVTVPLSMLENFQNYFSSFNFDYNSSCWLSWVQVPRENFWW